MRLALSWICFVMFYQFYLPFQWYLKHGWCRYRSRSCSTLFKLDSCWSNQVLRKHLFICIQYTSSTTPTVQIPYIFSTSPTVEDSKAVVACSCPKPRQLLVAKRGRSHHFFLFQTLPKGVDCEFWSLKLIGTSCSSSFWGFPNMTSSYLLV